MKKLMDEWLESSSVVEVYSRILDCWENGQQEPSEERREECREYVQDQPPLLITPTTLARLRSCIHFYLHARMVDRSINILDLRSCVELLLLSFVSPIAMP